MKILLTGGCGFLGSHLIEYLLSRRVSEAWPTADKDEVEIVVLDKLTYASNGYNRLRDIARTYGEEAWGRVLLAARVRVLGCDLSLPVTDGVRREIGDDIDFIVHAAAESHVDHSIVDPLPFLQSNVIGTHHLLMLARDLHKLRRIFVVSTDEVYGPAPLRAGFSAALAQGSVSEGPAVDGFDEEAPFRPANPYAASKAGGEAVAMAYANTYGLPITILNTMNLIGERQHPEKFLPLVIRKVMQGETVIIHADPTRTVPGARFYLHCRAFAHALWWLICEHCRGPGTDARWPRKIHICGEREISNLDLAMTIAAYIGRPLHHELVDFHSSRPGHDLRYAMDDSLIHRLGWKRPMNLEESLYTTVQWYLANPHWLSLAKGDAPP